MRRFVVQVAAVIVGTLAVKGLEGYFAARELREWRDREIERSRQLVHQVREMRNDHVRIMLEGR